MEVRLPEGNTIHVIGALRAVRTAALDRTTHGSEQKVNTVSLVAPRDSAHAATIKQQDIGSRRQ